jgi:hypothetical protein
MTPTPWIILALVLLWVTCGVIGKLQIPPQEFNLGLVELLCGVAEWIAAWLLRLSGASRAFADHYRTLKARDMEDAR